MYRLSWCWFWALVCLVGVLPLHAETPLYKPSSRSPQPMDITLNPYGSSRNAPDALAIGDVAPDFRVAQAGGGELSLADARRQGDVVLVFYRGHW